MNTLPARSAADAEPVGRKWTTRAGPGAEVEPRAPPPQFWLDLRPKAGLALVSSGGGAPAAAAPTVPRPHFLGVRNGIPLGDSKGNETRTLRASRPAAALPVSGTRFLNEVRGGGLWV